MTDRAPTTTAVLALVVTTVASVTVLSHHHRRPHAVALALVPPLPLTVRASRGEPRLPLLPVHASVLGKGATRHHVRPSRLAGAAAHLSDVTMYCPTSHRNAAGRWPALGDVAVLDRSIPFGTRVRIDGNVYVVEDWIGASSDWDIFGGNDAGCEQRALMFGRKRLRVVEVAR